MDDDGLLLRNTELLNALLRVHYEGQLYYCPADRRLVTHVILLDGYAESAKS